MDQEPNIAAHLGQGQRQRGQKHKKSTFPFPTNENGSPPNQRQPFF